MTAESKKGKEILEAGRAYTEAKERLETAIADFEDSKKRLEELALTVREEKALARYEQTDKNLTIQSTGLIQDYEPQETLDRITDYNPLATEYKEFYGKRVEVYSDKMNRVIGKIIKETNTQIILEEVSYNNTKRVQFPKEQVIAVIEREEQ